MSDESPVEGRLLSGSQLLISPDEPTRSFGSVSGETGASGDGFVQVSLEVGSYVLSFAHGLSLRLAEDRAQLLAERVRETCVRLGHLRTLNRLGKLNVRALIDGAVWTPSVVGAPKAVPEDVLALLPEPADEPTLAVLGDIGRITYRSLDESAVVIEIDGLRAVRLSAGRNGESCAGKAGSAHDSSSEFVGIPAGDQTLEHFMFAFPTRTFEIFALGFSVRPGVAGSV